MDVLIIGMGDNIAGQLLDQVQQWFSDKWFAVFDPIYLWYAAWIAALVVAGIIATFVPFKIVRLSLGLALALGAAFVWGGRTMGQRQRARVEELRRQLKEEKEKRGQTSEGGGSGGGFFDFFK
jgi:protein-S-isoprenylcysteine O-methyltransferase Ste14